jgi:hypothetical protein
MAALGLPIALVLGALADLAGGLASRVTGSRDPWWRPVVLPWDEARRLLRSGSRRGRPTVVEALGGVGATLGGGLSAAGALGLIPGSAALVYLTLALGVTGLMLAEPVKTAAGEVEAALRRRVAAVVEPAFVLALGALLLRWRSFDLDAIRADQTVLGPSLSVGPVPAAAAAILAGLAALAATALRLGPSLPGVARRERQARGAGSRLVLGMARWSVAGASLLVVAVLVAGHRLDLSSETAPFGATVVAAVVLLGVGAAVAGRLSTRWRFLVGGGAFLLAVAAAVLAAAS